MEMVQVQRVLQLQIEQQAQLLRKLMEEQKKGGTGSSSLSPESDHPPQIQPADTTTLFPSSSAMTHTDTHSPKRKASQSSEPEQQCEKRHRGECSTKPPIFLVQ
ncbi:hypothetical protein COLO4_09002 [Corchorus olitorius]|uniref:MYB-CC type transcription factor LHEQLE-containing domain-containing protein n=1 Tax=Corchorus olitorius TaxID=93759 RepID=A0A1R3KDL1_9ROSI|nr:hypothetical protein COLO4_09002 [Corchorus olitorius]